MIQTQKQMTLLEQGQYATAIIQLREAIVENPWVPENYYQLGTALALEGQMNEAIAVLQQAIKLNPDYSEAHSNLGVLLALQGNLDEAIVCYRQAARLQADLPEVHNNLGLLLKQQGNLAEAVVSFRQAITLKPDYAEAHNNLGLVLSQQGETEAAIASFRQALAHKPDYIDVLNHLGLFLKSNGELEEAETHLQKAMQLYPQGAIAYNYLGTIRKEQKKLEEAAELYQKAIQLDPDYADAYRNLGVILVRQNLIEKAIDCFQTALRLQPNFPEAFNNLGIVAKMQGKLAQAAEYFQKAIEARPHYGLAHKNLADIWTLLGRREEAIASYQQAINLDPSNQENWASLCGMLSQQKRLGEALAWCDRGLELYPEAVDLYRMRASIYSQLKKWDKVVDDLRRALELEPENSDIHLDLGCALFSCICLTEAREMLQKGYAISQDPVFLIKHALSLPIILSDVEQIEQERQRMLEELQALNSQTISFKNPASAADPTFYLAYHGRNDRLLREQTASVYLKACPDLAWVAPHCRGTRNVRERLRVGFCSSLLRSQHTMGKLYGNILAQLPRELFEIVLLRIGADAESKSDKLNSYVDRVINLEGDIDILRQQIAEQELDLLFYTDIGMDQITYLLAFARLAPVQCMTWGHPSTTGIANMDYFLSATVFDREDAQDHYSETLIRLQEPGIYFVKPTLPAPVSREEFGLPATGTLYLCPQSSFKMHPEFDAILGDLLRRDPQGYIVMLEGMSASWDEKLKERWTAAIPDVMERIRFVRRLKYEEYLQLLMLGDVMLDPIHFGGGNTSLEAFATNLPIVTWPGDYLRSRLTYGFYQKMELLDCVVWDAKAYVEVAYRLAHDANWGAQIRQEIQSRSGVLYSNQAAISEIARFFQLAVAAYDCDKKIKTWR